MNKSTKAYLLGLLLGASLVTLLLIFTPPTETRTESIFVYGTLQNPVVRSFFCLCTTSPEPRTLRGYEKVGRNIVPNDTSEVNGSVIHVTPTELARLDRYERVPEKYRRERIEIADETHWVYLLNE